MFSHLSVQVMFGLWLAGRALVTGTGNTYLLWLAPLGIAGREKARATAT